MFVGIKLYLINIFDLKQNHFPQCSFLHDHFVIYVYIYVIYIILNAPTVNLLQKLTLIAIHIRSNALRSKLEQCVLGTCMTRDHSVSEGNKLWCQKWDLNSIVTLCKRRCGT